jgi:intracellular septation protein
LGRSASLELLIMKLFFDLLPVLLFFVVYQLAGANPATAESLAQTLLRPFIGGGAVPPGQVPILLATATAIVASLLQVAWQLARGRRVDAMLWLSVVVIVVFGGATIWLHDETFIKWKPSILYALFAAILAGGRLFAQRNFVQTLLGEKVALPPPIWNRLLWAWVGFFVAMAAINLIVAYSVPTATWVSFKLFGLLGLTLLFTLGIGFWMARYMPQTPDA